MRRAPLLLLAGLLLAACQDPFDKAMEANTVEAFETFLAENPNSPYKTQGEVRLEELILEKARAEKTLSAYDDYLKRYPKGKLREKALEERREFLFAWADQQDTVEAWNQFLQEYPTGDKKKKVEARQRLRMAENKGLVDIGTVSIEQVNLAENPDGPLDGWGIYAPVTIKGDKAVATLMLQVAFLGSEGQVLQTVQWPVVAPRLPQNLPVAEAFKVPMKPGETRTFEWTTGDLPTGWARKVALKPVDIRFVGEAAATE